MTYTSTGPAMITQAGHFFIESILFVPSSP
jgi:hypothetical protein